jgi:hypothetical protein
MRVNQEQNMLETTVNPENNTNAAEATGAGKDCKFCTVKK